ncbi:MAG: hypothetical protein KF824_03610 [Fimbriimonadaceae bacterium]|nr:MAG: hypothetical protein KF824_03610 [Fimbriimonadaceae bacterium]
MRSHKRASISCLFALLSASAFAGTITLAAPNEGDFLGKANTITFNITNASAQVTVLVKLTQVADPTVSISTTKQFTPDVDGKINGSINFNLSEGLTNGAYTLQVTPTEPGATYNVLAPLNVTVDVKDPKFLQFNPIDAGFVRGSVIVTAEFLEDNMKEWRVQVNGSDIPNNTGNTNNLMVIWDSSLEATDGTKSIALSSEDLAGNSANRSISVTVDRTPPTSTVLAPTPSDPVFGNGQIPVVVQVQDQFNGSLDARTIDVLIRDTSGNFITRVARRSVNNNGSSVTWSGRIRDLSRLPSVFDIVVIATDKAGNLAADQTVRITQGGRGVSEKPHSEGPLHGAAYVSQTVRDTTQSFLRNGHGNRGRNRNN